ncbi:MAG: hypothetical protein PHS62_01335 [Patescibacteria group bacterium]|nr:hypothetical protein [Patescibacteria group bacterium]
MNTTTTTAEYLVFKSAKEVMAAVPGQSVFEIMAGRQIKHLVIDPSQVGWPVCQEIAEYAPDGITIIIPIVCRPDDVAKAITVLAQAKLAWRCLRLSANPAEEKDWAKTQVLAAIQQAKQEFGRSHLTLQIHFSLGCSTWLVYQKWLIAALKEIVEAGVTVINWPSRLCYPGTALITSTRAALPEDVSIWLDDFSLPGCVASVVEGSYLASGGLGTDSKAVFRCGPAHQ